MKLLLSMPARLLTGLAILFWLALFVATHLPKAPRIVTASELDKACHFLAFAALAFLFCWAVSSRRQLTLAVYAAILSLIALYAAIDELLQAPLPHRSADPIDWLADIAGAACGALAFSLVASVGGRIRGSC
jgi:VanZ family protein